MMWSRSSRTARRLQRKNARKHAQRKARLRIENLESRVVPTGDPLQQIDHFVVIYQENWSFDGLYGSFPGANGIASASAASLTQRDRVTGLPLDPAMGGLPKYPGQTNDATISDNAVTDAPKPYDLGQFLQPSDKTGDIVHRFFQEQSQIDHGAMDKFIGWSDNTQAVMSHFDATNLPEGLLAQQYTMDDNFFHAAFGGSFLNHQFLVSSAAPVYPNAPASMIATLGPDGQLVLNANGSINHDGNVTPIGGASFGDPGQSYDKNYAINTIFSDNLLAKGTNLLTDALGHVILPTNALPTQNDNDPNGPNYIPTIGDRLNGGGISWKWYSGGWDNALQSSPSNPVNNGQTPANALVDPLFQWHHQPMAYYNNFAPFLYDPASGKFVVNSSSTTINADGSKHLEDETSFFSDVSASNLPAVTFIKPLGPDNEHPGYASLLQGQQHVANIVQAIQNNPSLWAHTAIIVTYDENGGRWDQVPAPDANGIWGDGSRVPGIVISPYAKRHYVDHTQHDTLSILKTIEDRFSLQPLNQYDAAAISLASSFGPYLAVGAGDATSTDAVLWTRIQPQTGTNGVGVIAQVSTDPSFATGIVGFAGVTDPAHDYTVHIDATGLQPGTRYYYRFVADDGTVSPAGTFVTAPSSTAIVPVSFGFTGDADGLMRPYDATNSPNFAPPTDTGVGSQNFDYFVWLGDTIYETASGQGTVNSSPAVNNNPNITEYWRKYREQFLPVSTGTYPGLTNFFDSTGHYTLLDNHELGNRQYINGGAPANAPFNTTDSQYDVNTTGTCYHNTAAYKILQQAYDDYQPVRVGTVSAPGDLRSDGTQKMYFSQQWGANSVFINVDDRTNRDIRLRKVAGTGTADDTGDRADNPGRTMLGATELQWLEQSLLTAEQNGITWKIVATSSPIDQIDAIGSGADGGKSWMGGYRAERNALMKFIADNHIDHVVFFSTDDHLLRVNEVGYFTQFTTNSLGYPAPVQSSYTRVPGAFSVIAGPIGATGPDTVTDHSFTNIQNLANALVASEVSHGVDPIGLDPAFPGLKNVSREGDATADATRTGVDFYSPDTFNYATFNLSADGSTLTVGLKGINSYATNTFPQPGPGNAVRDILSFQIGLENTTLTVPTTYGVFAGITTLTATLTDSAMSAPVAGKTVTFTLGGTVVGSAVTDASGVATLSNVDISAYALGAYPGEIKASFTGDVGTMKSSGAGTLVVTNIVLGPDPSNPGQTALFVGGTPGDDHIQVQSQDHGNTLRVKFESASLHWQQDVTSAVSRIFVYGGPGDDHIEIDNQIVLQAFLFGGDGNDHLQGGGGPTVAVGGAGQDHVEGGQANSILIGGLGADHVESKGGNGLLIGGVTNFDSNAVALVALLNEWTRTDESYAQRVANLQNAPAGATNPNGSYTAGFFLDTSTTHDDGAGNQLDGGPGLDWFFANLDGDGNNGVKDKIGDLKTGEFVTKIKL